MAPDQSRDPRWSPGIYRQGEDGAAGVIFIRGVLIRSCVVFKATHHLIHDPVSFSDGIDFVGAKNQLIGNGY